MAPGVNTSLFNVGLNITLDRVIIHVSILVVCVMVLERLLHKLEHHLRHYPKYHDMMTKVFGELMILGLIGIGIKILKELGGLDPYSTNMLSFQAADVMVFTVAIALIIQSTVVFLRMRRKNIQVDKAELISTTYLVEHIGQNKLPSWFDEFASVFTYARHQNRRQLTTADIPEVAKQRILRHFFLKRYGLPEMFPFSKYLRQAQDNQISHMIEVEISTWFILLLIAWALDGVAEVVSRHWTTKFSSVVAFVFFSWLSVLLHMGITMYFTWAIDKLLDAAVGSHGSKSRRTDRYEYLETIADQEAHDREHELATDSLETMEKVREREQRKHIARHRNILTEHDMGFQLVATAIRKVSSKKLQISTESDDYTEAKTPVTSIEDGIVMEPEADRRIHLAGFSRKAWHFIIVSALMLNAFYVALFCQCVAYLMDSIYKLHGLAPMFLIPLPLLLNMVIFQPRIMRNFVLVASIIRVDDSALGNVIENFTDTVQLRANFVRTVHDYLEANNLSIQDVQNAFEKLDVLKDGKLDIEDVRYVLKKFGFSLSYFGFNSVVKLLFNPDGVSLDYSQVIRLLEIGQSEEVRAFTHRSGHLDRRVAASFLAVENLWVALPNDSEQAITAQQKTLLRSKSSAANSLYNADAEELVNAPSSRGGAFL